MTIYRYRQNKSDGGFEGKQAVTLIGSEHTKQVKDNKGRYEDGKHREWWVCSSGARRRVILFSFHVGAPTSRAAATQP